MRKLLYITVNSRPEKFSASKTVGRRFVSSDAYAIAVPMWSLSFPSPLKEYVDCIMQHGITIEISPEHMGGLLGDKKRSAVYIQSSGAKMTWLTHSLDKV